MTLGKFLSSCRRWLLKLSTGEMSKDRHSEQNKQTPKGLDYQHLLMFLVGVVRKRGKVNDPSDCRDSSTLGREEKPAIKIQKQPDRLEENWGIVDS